ncbi:amino acid permease 2-like [Neltuma alba]|uniref:amino acid permease 2-like n=1 Tax=Neltuma alba TaxID=207710 RepID=UPI0010A5733A|nr:amino acid permease 2-like [Prosopis alba]
MLLFAVVILYTSSLLCDCYRLDDAVSGKRNYTYMDAVASILGGVNVKLCGIFQHVSLVGVAVGYTIAASISVMAIKRSNCLHEKGGGKECNMSSNPYMVGFGVIQVFLSQIPDFDQIWWLSIVAAIMSFTYSTIGLSLGIANVAETGKIKGSLRGISTGTTLTQTDKVWRNSQALGDIAFANSFSIVLIEIQDTIKSPPSEAKTMKKATTISIAVTTTFCILCGCTGNAALGDKSPGNLLTDLAFSDPFWLLDAANAAIAVHLVGAYQVFSQPIFAFMEKQALQRFPRSQILKKEFKVPLLPGFAPYNLSLLRLVSRTSYVVVTTLVSMLLPFFNDVVGIIGALGFWPLNVYFPVEMYIKQKKITKWSGRWVFMQILSMACLVVSIVAGVGSFAGAFLDLKKSKPFHY